MRIFLSSKHSYPAKRTGSASQHISDLLAKGLMELGHEVLYHFQGKQPLEPLPKGIRVVDRLHTNVDILHLQDGKYRLPTLIPWLKTYHAAAGHHKVSENFGEKNIVFVSKAHANSFGRTRYVYNGIDPANFQYQETKEDYFIFLVHGLERAIVKGLGMAIMLVQELGINLVVAGSSKNPYYQRIFQSMCKEQGIKYVGEIREDEKAAYIAGAKCLLAPSLMPEPFGLVMAEALMSGTPVICSDRGAFPEIVSSEVGFVCSKFADYVHAVENIHTIKASDCRAKAEKDFHYRRMAADYVKEYQREIEHPNASYNLQKTDAKADVVV